MITEEKRTENGWVFVVKISAKDGSLTRHVVTVDDDHWKKLTYQNFDQQALAEKSIEFLLARESKESILPEFNLSDIQKYFPDYESFIQEQVNKPLSL